MSDLTTIYPDNEPARSSDISYYYSNRALTKAVIANQIAYALMGIAKLGVTSRLANTINYIAMPSQQKKGCGCGSIPISVILVVLGLGGWGFTKLDDIQLGEQLVTQIHNRLPESIAQHLPDQNQTSTEPLQEPDPSKPDLTTISGPLESNTDPLTNPAETSTSVTTSSPESTTSSPAPSTESTTNQNTSTVSPTTPLTAWEQKEIRGIYLSRYMVTNNADEQTIRQRVRYYRSKGINTIIHGVWGNGCTMYNSDVMQQTWGYKSCPNLFQDQWLDWLIDEAHKQGMEVHAYFEKGIKLDENSPIFDTAAEKRWFVPGIDQTYPGVDHYLLDVEVPEVSGFFKAVLAEFVQKYPEIDAVQWDDYLGYHDELPGKVDRTAQLTQFVLDLQADMKAANPNVSFDLCHHNPYWGKRYFAADWENWNVDRAFIQIYNDDNFDAEIDYAEQYSGIAITENQLHRLEALLNNDKIQSVLIFPAAGDPEQAASLAFETASQF